MFPDLQYCIPVEATSVHFLRLPDEFYQEILKRISSSKSRIVFAALYLGTGQKEQQIVSRLQTACSENAELEISFLLDYFRGTRGEPNNSSTSILKPLLENKNVQVSLFHTPEMRGLLKFLLPGRLNEIIGVQHMKFFIFDDSIIISGANLSDQYFDNRQDRYMVVEDCPRLADFFHSISTIMSKHSMQLDKFGKLNFFGSASIHPFTGSNEEIQKSIKTEIFELFDKCKGNVNNLTNDTFIYPFLQMGVFDIKQEVRFLRNLFNKEENIKEINLITAYFNLCDEYADWMLQKRPFLNMLNQLKLMLFLKGISLFQIGFSSPIMIIRNKSKEVAKDKKDEKVYQLWEFLDRPDNWGMKELSLSRRPGRSWTADELRLKSNSDLHKLWYVLLKERNMLLTMREAYKIRHMELPNPERIDRVKESMDNIEVVVHERNDAYLKLETGKSASPPRRKITSFAGFTYEVSANEYYGQPEVTGVKKEYEVPMLDDKAYLFQKLWKEKEHLKEQIRLQDEYLLEDPDRSENPELLRGLRRHFDRVEDLPEQVVARRRKEKLNIDKIQEEKAI
uniref:CDP-diacylglycerol--glycerol-3-phosphate 3-phosphatidyltransferase n=1 Tax=Meloidogyne incognita TaxID=6306 RepID=A0A914MGA8_MELIC